MKALSRTLLLSLSCVMLLSLPLEAQNRRESNGNRPRTERQASSSRNNQGHGRPVGGRDNSQSSARPSTSRPVNKQDGFRPGAANNNNNNGSHQNQGVRPGSGNNNGSHQNQGVRPGNNNNSGNNQGNRPGNNQGNRPGNNWSNNNNPGHGGNNGNYRPGAGANRPSNGMNPGKPETVRPGMGLNRPPVVTPSHNPNRPHKWCYAGRPTPPPFWRPAGHRPLFSTMLGLTLGTSFNISINALIGNGYLVDGYSNNTIYLNDVPQLGMTWPFASLFYNSYGMLTAGEFVYSTPGPDNRRYYDAYNRLCSLYGPPVSFNNYSAYNFSASWWGGDNQFVTLSFDYRQPASGPFRYFTTLTFGN